MQRIVTQLPFHPCQHPTLLTNAINSEDLGISPYLWEHLDIKTLLVLPLSPDLVDTSVISPGEVLTLQYTIPIVLSSELARGCVEILWFYHYTTLIFNSIHFLLSVTPMI